jgi:tRNA pseudouridine55 synthase
MTGVLVVDKPAGPTSHDVVTRVRRAIGERRIGHTGTLDPFATGVLPLVVGTATRLAPLLSGDEKEYVAGIRLGYATNTYDVTGARVHLETGRKVDDLTRGHVESALDAFRGTFEQMPPAFSAKKVGGVAAYRLARRHHAVELAPAIVTVSALALESLENGLATVRLTCSAGFYVRSLAHDLGQRLGCGAHLEALRRTRAGSFTEGDAVTLEMLEEEGRRAGARLVSGDRLLPELPAAVLTEGGVRRARHGNFLSPSDVKRWLSPFSAQVPQNGRQPKKRGQPPFPVRLFDDEGRLLGIADRRADGALHPSIVLV